MDFDDRDDAPQGAPDWIVTFADLMSLLLTFFVLLLSMSSIQIDKYRLALGSIKAAFGAKDDLSLSEMPAGENVLPSLRQNPGGEGEAQGEGPTPAEMEQELQRVLQESGLAKHGQAKLTQHGAILQLNGDLLFESGAAEINPAALPVLEGLADYIATVDRSIDIIGHTDDVPISTPTYPSNWELSAARAGQAVRYMVERGVRPQQLRAIGQADTVPLVPNDSPENRAKNRRVEFVFTERRSEADTITAPVATQDDDAETAAEAIEEIASP